MKDAKQHILDVSAQTEEGIKDISIFIDSNSHTVWRP